MPRAEPTAALEGHQSISGYEGGNDHCQEIGRVVEQTHPLRHRDPRTDSRTNLVS